MRVVVAFALGVGCLAPGCARSGTVGIVEDEGDGSVSAGDGADEGGSGTLLDLPEGMEMCTDRGEMMGVGPCLQSAPPDSFDPVLQWSWTGPGEDTDTFVIPLIANVTDDNGDGRINLCDTPDVIVTAAPPAPANLVQGPPIGRIYALDGATGMQHWVSTESVRSMITPAVGDIDGDDEVEIVTLQAVFDPDVPPYRSRLIVFDADGSVAFTGDEEIDAPWSGAVALADLDVDGSVEIMVGNRVFDDRGRQVFEAPELGGGLTEPLMPFGIDLDADGDLEVLWGKAAYHHDGAPHFVVDELRHGFAAAANLDDDPGPEIVVTTEDGIAVLQADGTPTVLDARPLDIPMGSLAWRRPVAIHDIDGNREGDRRPEVLVSVGAFFLALKLDPVMATLDAVWMVDVADASGSSAGTAFDFLGDRGAEAMYADEVEMYVFDPEVGIVLQAARSSVTVQEYPVVADVDNDGSAEIVVGSNAGFGGASDPTVRVFSEASSRWVQARRIWNQHTYHVSNVTEHGEIPSPEPQFWQRTNTFRTNAQIEGGVICLPEP